MNSEGRTNNVINFIIFWPRLIVKDVSVPNRIGSDHRYAISRIFTNVKSRTSTKYAEFKIVVEVSRSSYNLIRSFKRYN